MFKNFLVICAVVFCTTGHAESIQTIGSGYGKGTENWTKEQKHQYFEEIGRSTHERKVREWEESINPEIKPYIDGSRKVRKAVDISFCTGYSKVKIEQHNNQYYKDMYQYYNSQISDTDMMSTKVDRESFLHGYDMNDDKKILDCVNVYENERGFK